VIVGRSDPGSRQWAVDTDTKRVARFTMPVAANVAKGRIYLDGLGGGSGQQACRQVIYDAADNLIAVSDEVIVEAGQAAQWVDFVYSMYGGDLALPVGDFFSGIFAGGVSDVIRVYGDDPYGAGGKRNSDTYADGASNPFGAATSLTAGLSLYLLCFAPFATVRPVTADIDYARLPFNDAQEVLAMNGPDAQKRQRLVDVGWHGTFLDPERGSVALVRDTSPLMDLLGERVKVTRQGAEPRSVVAYVYNVADAAVIDWDLSLSRHLYAQLGMLAEETTSCIVEVLN
jgi:hypothetical protein